MSELEVFIAELKALESYQVQSFFCDEYDGSCPCFEATKTLNGETVRVGGRCWRVSENEQDLYIGGTLDTATLEVIANIVKNKLDEQEWYLPYTIIYENETS